MSMQRASPLPNGEAVWCDKADSGCCCRVYLTLPPTEAASVAAWPAWAHSACNASAPDTLNCASMLCVHGRQRGRVLRNEQELQSALHDAVMRWNWGTCAMADRGGPPAPQPAISQRRHMSSASAAAHHRQLLTVAGSSGEEQLLDAGAAPRQQLAFWRWLPFGGKAARSVPQRCRNTSVVFDYEVN